MTKQYCTARIRELNDLLRTTFLMGKVLMTEGVRALPDNAREEIITQIRAFDAFTSDNDPHGEHDFGALYRLVSNVEWVTKIPAKREHYDCSIFWKIDYYDKAMQQGSEDPCDPKKTCRVLTILLAEEW